MHGNAARVLFQRRKGVGGSWGGFDGGTKSRPQRTEAFLSFVFLELARGSLQ